MTTAHATIAVIFEVIPTEAGKERYLQLAAGLREEIMKAPGVISFERFSSLSKEGKLLSLSFWADGESVDQWRNVMAHRMAQQAGFCELFEEYTIRVCRVMREYTMTERAEAPSDSNAFLQS